MLAMFVVFGWNTIWIADSSYMSLKARWWNQKNHLHVIDLHFEIFCFNYAIPMFIRSYFSIDQSSGKKLPKIKFFSFTMEYQSTRWYLPMMKNQSSMYANGHRYPKSLWTHRFEHINIYPKCESVCKHCYDTLSFTFIEFH